MPQPRQPFLHDLLILLAAPTQLLSADSGAIGGISGGPTAQGLLHADVRVLSRLETRVDGQTGIHLASALVDQTATVTTLFRSVGADLATTPDPQVRLDEVRTLSPGMLRTTLTLDSRLDEAVETELTVTLAGDGATVEEIKSGASPELTPFEAEPDGDRIGWRVRELMAGVTAPGAELGLTEDRCALTLRWPVAVPARGSASVGWSVEVGEVAGVVVAAPPGGISLVGGSPAEDGDHRLGPWLSRSVADLNALRMATPASPEEEFYAAGVPWYLTLFGRDSLWTARMVLPLDLAPARGTLRTLARLQGVRDDPDTAEEPGKIMHELRRAAYTLGEMSLPPLYYGTIDATALWICLLHDAWRAGLSDPDVIDLLPALDRALDWLTGHPGFLRYIDASGRGLANQGWKDSRDSVRFHDGQLAVGPVALCEVQGYAYEAAVSGAALLDAFDRPGAEDHRRWAAQLAEAFRAAFWCGAGPDRYPALALDGEGRRVDALTSNIGHLLGTGLLDPEEEQLVARRVSGPELDSGLGLRTMATSDGGYAPLSYHCGSVWPHDTAIVIRGLHRAGLGSYAAGLVDGLLTASVAFDRRLPELWSGEGRAVPYPAACRPQAWSAAAAVVVAGVLGQLPAANPDR